MSQNNFLIAWIINKQLFTNWKNHCENLKLEFVKTDDKFNHSSRWKKDCVVSARTKLSIRWNFKH